MAVKYKFFIAVFAAGVYSIWKERNYQNHGKQSAEVEMLLKVNKKIGIWMKGCCRKQLSQAERGFFQEMQIVIDKL